MIAIHPRYITDQEGKKISAVLPIKEFHKLIEEIEELEDLRLYDEGKNDNEPPLSKKEAMRMLEVERRNLEK